MKVIIFFLSISLFILSISPMEIISPEEQEILDRKALRNFMMLNEGRNLQIKMGTELCRAAYLEQFYVPVPTVQERKIHLNSFQTITKNVGTRIGYYPSANSYFRGCAINRAGTHIAIPIWPHHLFIKDLNEPKQVEIPLDNIYKHGWISDVEWSAYDTYISFYDNSKTLVYNVHTGKYINSFNAYIYCWHPQKDTCLFMIIGNTVHIVDILTGHSESIAVDIQYPICDFVCSPDCHYLAIDEHHDIFIIDLHKKSSFQCNIKLGGHINLLAWSSDSRYLAFQCGKSYTLVVWDVENNKSVFEKNIHQLKSLAWTPHDEQLVGVECPTLNPQNGMMMSDQQRIFINPWEKQMCDQANKETALIDLIDSRVAELMIVEQDANIKLDTVPGQQKIDDEDDMHDVYPLYDEKNHSLEHFMGEKTEISHQGKFIINVDKKCIAVRDYSNELFVLKYLREQIPLKQALVLLALGKKTRNKEKLIIDSQAMQEAFEKLPECLKMNLNKWVVKNIPSDKSCMIS